jgi:hypothetical protein
MSWEEITMRLIASGQTSAARRALMLDAATGHIPLDIGEAECRMGDMNSHLPYSTDEGFEERILDAEAAAAEEASYLGELEAELEDDLLEDER